MGFSLRFTLRLASASPSGLSRAGFPRPARRRLPLPAGRARPHGPGPRAGGRARTPCRGRTSSATSPPRTARIPTPWSARSTRIHEGHRLDPDPAVRADAPSAAGRRDDPLPPRRRVDPLPDVRGRRLERPLGVPSRRRATFRPSVGLLSASPENPPAFSTWVVSWSTLGTGPGPGIGVANLKFRIRRTSALEPDGKEWVVDGGAASFAGPPGDYVFEVRAESSCGSVGPWSPPKKVTVGTVAKPSLVLVSEPAPLARLVPAAGACARGHPSRCATAARSRSRRRRSAPTRAS